MAQHNIDISVLNDNVGIPQDNEGIFEIFAKAVAVASTFSLDTPYLLTQLADLADLGIDAAYDATNNVAVYQQISDFYAQAGDGALVWLVGVAKATAYATYVASATFDSMIQFTAISDPNNRAKMIGLCYDVPVASQSATDFPADVAATITALQTKQVTMFNHGYQWSAILDGYKMSTTVTPSTIGTMANKSAPAVSLCITGIKPNGVSGVGFALGRFARIGIGHGFGAVEDGPMNTSAAYLTNAVTIPATGTLVVGKVYTVFGGAITYNSLTYNPGDTFTAVTGQTTFTTSAAGYVVENLANSDVSKLSPTYIDSLGSKQYMFLRTWFGKAGFFWNDGATCEALTKQLNTQEYDRVANALSADALVFFINQMGKNLPLDPTTGAVAQSYLNGKQAEFFSTYIEPISVNGGTGDITTGSMILSAPNFNSTKTMNFTLTIVPTPILGNVVGVVKFSATL